MKGIKNLRNAIGFYRDTTGMFNCALQGLFVGWIDSELRI